MTDAERMALADLERFLGRPSLSHREIAKLIGVSHGTVHNIERRALRKLRVLLEKEGPS